jgi:hypothetical protein
MMISDLQNDKAYFAEYFATRLLLMSLLAKLLVAF